MEETRLKRCTKCGEEKPFTFDFYPRSNAKKLKPFCKSCDSKRNVERYWARKALLPPRPPKDSRPRLARTSKIPAPRAVKPPKTKPIKLKVEKPPKPSKSPKPPKQPRIRAELIGEKCCTACQEVLPLENFTASKKAYGLGYKGRCKSCEAAKKRERRAANPEIYRRKAREWTAKNRERAGQYHKKWARENPEKIRELSRKAYWKDRDKHIASAQRRRAQRLGVRHKLSSSDIALRYRQQKGLCFYCSKKLNETKDKKGCVEHWIPVSKGGENVLENIVMACRTCNGRKWNKMPWEFLPERFTEADVRPPI